MSTHTRMTTWWHGLFFAINLNIFLLFIYFSVSTTTEEIRMDHFTLSLSIYHFFFVISRRSDIGRVQKTP